MQAPALDEGTEPPVRTKGATPDGARASERVRCACVSMRSGQETLRAGPRQTRRGSRGLRNARFRRKRAGPPGLATGARRLASWPTVAMVRVFTYAERPDLAARTGEVEDTLAEFMGHGEVAVRHWGKLREQLPELQL